MGEIYVIKKLWAERNVGNSFVPGIYSKLFSLQKLISTRLTSPGFHNIWQLPLRLIQPLFLSSSWRPLARPGAARWPGDRMTWSHRWPGNRPNWLRVVWRPVVIVIIIMMIPPRWSTVYGSTIVSRRRRCAPSKKCKRKNNKQDKKDRIVIFHGN